MFIKQDVQSVVDVFRKRFAVILVVGVFLVAISLSVLSIQSANAGFAPGNSSALPANEETGGLFNYLPLVMRNFPSVLTPPVLNTINNDDGDGNYTISWSASTGATTYTLQEAGTADFSNPSTVYAGSATSTDISGRYLGTYYYRVRASSAHADSDWSNVESVEVAVFPDCPAIGMWYGTTSQGQNSVITFEVQDSPYCRIPESVIGVNPKFGFTIRFWDSCGTERNITNLDEIPIVNHRFNFSGENGTYEGEFTSVNTASGTFSYVNGSCLASGTWTAELPPPGSFGKDSPADGTTVQPPGTTLKWSASLYADSYEYCYDTIDDNTCMNWVNTGTTSQASIDGLSPSTTYYWQVRAVNDVGTTYANGDTTAYWSFTTSSGTPGNFTKLSPADGATVQLAGSLTLDWGISSFADSYAYCYDTTDDNACTNWVETGTVSQAIISGLSRLTTYYWQVRATNSYGTTYADGAETAHWSFTIEEGWTQMTAEAEWSARWNHTSVALPDGSIVLMGGFTGDQMDDVWRSTDQGATWTQMTASAEWSARNSSTSVTLLDGSIVLMGGYDGSSRKNDVWRSTDMGATWTQMTASAEWSGRTGHTSVVLPDSSIVLMGGYDGSSLNDVWRSTDMGATWIEMTAAAEWSERHSHTSVALPDGSIVLMGGYDGSSRKNDVWRSTDQGATWIEMTAAAEWSERHSHTSVALPDGSIVLMGGVRLGGYENDVWRSTDMGATWIEMTAAVPWTARYAHTSVGLPDGSIVLMGGHDDGDLGYKNDVWQLVIGD